MKGTAHDSIGRSLRPCLSKSVLAIKYALSRPCFFLFKIFYSAHRQTIGIWKLVYFSSVCVHVLVVVSVEALVKPEQAHAISHCYGSIVQLE